MTEIEILYQDDALIVINKPSGLLSVPGIGKPDCAIARVQEHFDDALIVHRLDMATSGLLIIARGKENHRNLSIQFQNRKVEKHYEALIWGHPDLDEGEVDLPLICDWPNRPKQMVCYERGKPSLTRWKVMQRLEKTTRMHLEPHTGRSHQLRVHMQRMGQGHPILGDEFYADGDAYNASDRLCLHAKWIKIRHPVSKELMEFTAAVPF